MQLAESVCKPAKDKVMHIFEEDFKNVYKD